MTAAVRKASVCDPNAETVGSPWLTLLDERTLAALADAPVDLLLAHGRQFCADRSGKPLTLLVPFAAFWTQIEFLI